MTRTNIDPHGQPTDHVPPILLPIPRAAETLGISRSMMYELCAQKLVRTVHIGKRHLVPVDALHEYANQLTR